MPRAQNNTLKDEADVLRSLGMAHQYIPVIWTDPRPEDFAAFCRAMDQAKGKVLLVHCAMNLRVTTFFAACAMRHLGWDRERADNLVNRAWSVMPESKRPNVWRAFMAKICE